MQSTSATTSTTPSPRLRPRSALSAAQSRAVDVLTDRERCSLWSKPGAGKTVVTLTAAADLYLARTLIVGTKRVARSVWRQEAARWDHLAHYRLNLIDGPPARRLKLLDVDAEFDLINYELLPWLIDTLGDLSRYDGVIFDEISKMKSPGTQRFRKLRKPILDVPVRFGMTGTPRGNAILGLWGQFYMTHGPSITPTYTDFKTRYFTPVDDMRRVWVPRPGAEKKVRKKAKRYAYATPPADAAPEARLNFIPIELPAAGRKHYVALENDLETTIGGHLIQSLHMGVSRGKKLQITSGAIYTTPGGEQWVPVHTAKMDALDELIEELQGDQLLIFFRFRHELERLQARYKRALATIDQIDDWLAQRRQLAAVHPASAAHGLNLHEGGAATQCWFTLPDSQELWEQGNRRLARKGQEREVVAHVLTTSNTIEDDIARELAIHGNLQDALISAAA